jgi:FkbM family methyltransferase
MKRMISLFMTMLRSLDVLHKASYPVRVKIRLAVTYLRMTCKLAFLDPFLHLKSEKFLGYQVHCSSYRVLHMLFGEIFILEEYFFQSESPAPCIIDCGANIGVATLYFKWRYPQARVCAFEPNASAFELLAKNVSQNRLENVKLWDAALSGQEGRVLFYADKLDAAGVTGSINPSSLAGQRTVVRAVRLSQFMESGEIDFVKMDIEGAEQQVVLEVSRSGRLCNVKQLAIEYHHRLAGEESNISHLLAELESLGFEYQIRASLPARRNGPQDIMVYACRS